MAAASPPLTVYAPLWGATFDSDTAGVAAERIMLCLPWPDEWRMVEKSDVLHARATSNPPLCLCLLFERRPEESARDGMARVLAEARRRLRGSVTALRLLREGWFLDPEFASLTFAVVREGGWDIERVPGPYRQALLGSEALPMTAYRSRLGDLRSQAGEGPMPRLAARVEAAMALDNPAVEVALTAFNRSYGFTLSPDARLAELFTALDAMFVGMRARRLGRVRINPRKFRARVAGALESSGLAPDQAAQEARWLDWDEGGRGIRNGVAHGRTALDDPGLSVANVLRLQAIVRAALPPFLACALAWQRDPDGVAGEVGLRGSVGPVLVFNRALEQGRRDLLG